MAFDPTSPASFQKTRLPVEAATTIDPRAYRNPDFFEIERDRVFKNAWVCVGYTSEVDASGKILATEVASQPLFVTRNSSGVLRAFYNVCRHRGALLVNETCEPMKSLRCPYHSWTYDLDGKLLHTPLFQKTDIPEKHRDTLHTRPTEDFCKQDFSLLPIHVQSFGCFIFVNLSENPMPLSDWLGDLPDRLKRYPLEELALVRRNVMQIEANWKLIAENFMEYYHLPWVHPALSNISGVFEHQRRQGPGMYTGMCTSPLTRDNSAIDRPFSPFLGLNEEEQNSAYWYYVFPNIALFLLPDHLFVLKLNPQKPHHTSEHADLLLHKSLAYAEQPALIDNVYNYWSRVNSEDIAIVERVQKGINVDKYPGGRLCTHFEEPLHRFQNMVIGLMTNELSIPKGD